MLHNGMVSQLAWVTPWLDRIRCVVIECDRRFRCTCPSRSFPHSRLCLCERLRHESTLILGHGYGHWSCSHVGKVVRPCRVFNLLQKLRSRTVSTLFEVRPIVESRDGVHERLISSIHDHFTYAIVLMNNLEIIDACLLLIITWSKLDAFMQKLNTEPYPCY